MIALTFMSADVLGGQTALLGKQVAPDPGVHFSHKLVTRMSQGLPSVASGGLPEGIPHHV